MHHVPAAHHGDAIGEPHHLVELVRDEDDRRSLVAQPCEHLEEVQRFLRREHRRGLVEDQHARPAVEHLEDLEPLAIAHGEVSGGGFEVDAQAGGHHEGLQSRPHRGLGAAQKEPGLRAEHHVLEGRERVHEHEVLVHHAQPQGDGVVGAAQPRALPEDLDRAAVGRVRPVEHRHERALAGAVLAHEGMHRTRGDRQVHCLVGAHRAEALVDPGHPHRDLAHASRTGPVDSRRMICGATTTSHTSVRRPAMRSISTVAAVSPMERMG